MQNDVLKNEIAPCQEKGRWYHITAVSDGTTWSIDNDRTDPEYQNATITNGYYVVVSDGSKPQPVDCKFILHSRPTSAVMYRTNNFTLYFSTARTTAVLTAVANYTGDVEIWVFLPE